MSSGWQFNYHPNMECWILDVPEVASPPSNGTVLKASQSLKSLRVYDRYLRTSEAVGNFQAGASEK